MYNYSVSNHLKAVFESKLELMRITLDTLSNTDLEKNKDMMKFYKILDNPVEQSICNGLILSMYGQMESCLMEVIQIIEDKTNVKYTDFSKQHTNSTLYKMRDYIEKYSSIRCDKYWCKQASYVATIRNSIVHNGSYLNKKYFRNRQKLEKYAILEQIQDTEIITITEDLKHLYSVLEVIENLLKELLNEEIKISLV